jgi:hypothetical protein
LPSNDAVTAFLNAKLDERLFVRLDEGATAMVQRHTLDLGLKTLNGNPVKLLARALYGTAQAPAAWNKEVSGYLRSFRFTQHPDDPCLLKRGHGSNEMLIVMWVDDFVMACTNLDVILDLKRQIMGNNDMKDLGTVSKFLGMSIHRTREGLSVNQEAYCNSMLERDKMVDCKAAYTPAEAKSTLSRYLIPGELDLDRKKGDMRG